MSRIEFGIVLPGGARGAPSRPAFVRDVDRALALAAGRFDSAWMVDHLQFGEDDVLECFTTLAFFAARHPQLKFGTNVLCQSFRSPALLAKMGATLQFLTGGRFALGLGAGWHVEEFRAYGYKFATARERVERLEEAVQIIRKMWREDSATFEGRYYQVREARCEPKPDPAPPLMIGAFRPGMLRLTAGFADCWSVSSTGLADYRKLLRQMERICGELGRDPATLRKAWSGGCACAPTRAAALELVQASSGADDPDDFDFIGSPEQLVEQMLAFVELGVDAFMLDCGGFPDLTTLEYLVAEVIPAVQQAAGEI